MNFSELLNPNPLQREMVSASFIVTEFTPMNESYILTSKIDDTRLFVRASCKDESDEEGLNISSTVSEMHLIIQASDQEFAIPLESNMILQFGLEDVIDEYMTKLFQKQMDSEAEDQKVEAYINRHGD